MSPTSWLAMEGQFCDGGNCSTCRQSEWSLATYLGREKTNSVFKQRMYHIFWSFSHSVIARYWDDRLGIMADRGRCERHRLRWFKRCSYSSRILDHRGYSGDTRALCGGRIRRTGVYFASPFVDWLSIFRHRFAV